MQLSEFQVKMFKGVIDSGPIGVDPLTVLVGKNESGKTTLLKALHKLNPATPEPYDIEHEWPRGRRRERRKDHVVCSAKFDLDQDEVASLATVTDQKMTASSVTVTRNYDGQLEVEFPSDVFPDKFHPNDVDKVCSTLPALPEGIGLAFKDAATKSSEEIRRLAREGRFSELEQARGRHATELQSEFSKEPPQLPQEQNYHQQYVAKLQEIAQKLPTIPSMRKKAHEYVVSRLPKFIYMSDYRSFKGKALLGGCPNFR